jgi:flagellar basal body-associated protein FliL
MKQKQKLNVNPRAQRGGFIEFIIVILIVSIILVGVLGSRAVSSSKESAADARSLGEVYR